MSWEWTLNASEAASILTKVRVRKVDVEKRSADHSRSTFLMLAARHGLLEDVKWLVSAGADFRYARTTYFWSALLFASQGNHISVVKYLIRKGADVNDNDGAGRNVLWWACHHRNIPLIQYLILAGANVNVHVGPSGGRTLLMEAVRHDGPAVVRCLVHAGANIHEIDADGWTALMFGCLGEGFPHAGLLVAAGAELATDDPGSHHI